MTLELHGRLLPSNDVRQLEVFDLLSTFTEIGELANRTLIFSLAKKSIRIEGSPLRSGTRPVQMFSMFDKWLNIERLCGTR
jgi:hypothetical protein